MTEYWLISAPGDKTCQQTWETMNNLTSKQNSLSVNYKFQIPDLKVGTLDQLVGLSDDLGKLDGFVEQITRKVASYLGEVLEDQKDKLQENLMANNSDLPSYITRFQWDIAKYPIKQSLRNIADIISKQVGQIDADLKTKSTAYNNLKGSLQNLEKKQTGSLLTRNLADLVKKEHFILDSEYLTTLLVIVPKALFHDWQANYEKLTDMIVPRSTVMIIQDSEYGLYTVTLFKKVADEFKLHAREKKFIVREFTYNEEELAAGKNEITKLVTDKKKQFGPLVRWLKVNFSECFCAWIHVKALRVFVESVLRYGLPVNFQAILIHPNKKTSKRLRDVLNQLYGHLDSSALQGSGNFDMKREDPMTTCICDKCLKVILNMFLFRKKSVNHDRKLKRQFGVSKELIVAKNLQEVVEENERIVAEMRENWEQKSVGIQVDFWTNGLQKSKTTSKRKSVAQAGKTPRKRKKTSVSFLKLKEEFPNLSFPRSAKTANLLPRVFLQKMEIAKPKKIDNVLPARRKYLRSFRKNQMEHKQDFEKHLENYEHLDLENREKLYFSSLELARSSESSVGNSVNGESRNFPESRVCVSEIKSESLQNVEGCLEGNCNVENAESECKPVVKKRVYRKKKKGTMNIFPSSWNGRRGVVGADGLCTGLGENRNSNVGEIQNSNQSVLQNTQNVPPTPQVNSQNPNQGQTLSQLLIFSPVNNQNEGSPSSSTVQNSSFNNNLVNLKPFQIHSAIPCLVQVNPSNSKQDTLTITPISQSLIQNQNADNSSRNQIQTKKSSPVSTPNGVVNNANSGSFPKNTPNSYSTVKVPNFSQNEQAQNSPTHSPVLNNLGKLYLPTDPYSLPQNPSFPKTEQTLNPPTHSPVPNALRDYHNPTLAYSLPQNPSFPQKVKPRKTKPSVLRKNRGPPQNPQVFPQSSSSQVTIQIQNPTANASIKNQTVLFISHHPAQNRNSFPKTQEEVPKLAPIAARLVHIQPKPNGFSVTPSTLSIVPCNEQNAIFPQEQLHSLPTASPHSRTKIVYSNNANSQNAASPILSLPNPQEDAARKVFDEAELAFLRGVLQRQNGPQHAVYKIVPSGRAQETPKDSEFAKLRPKKYQRVRTSKAAEIPPTIDTLAPQ